MSATQINMPTFSSKMLDQLRSGVLGSFFRPSRLQELGISYRQLRKLVSDGTLQRTDWGLYRVRDAEPTERHSLAEVFAKAPNSVLCLLSALQVHEIGTQVPHEVWLGIPHKARPPRVAAVKLRLVRFSRASWTYGVVPIEFEGVPARITNPARTVVDCFRFERLIGREAAMEALMDALGRKLVTVGALFRTTEVVRSRRLRAVLDAMPP